MIYSFPFLAYFLTMFYVAGLGTIDRELIPKDVTWIYIIILVAIIFLWAIIKLRRKYHG